MARITQLDPNLRQSGGGSGPIRYLPLDAPGLRVTGLLGWEEEQVLHRLPRAYRAVFETVNPAVAALGRDTAGGQLSFRSDTRALWLRAELEAPVELCHMTAIGQGGFDCYAGTDRRELAFVGVSKFPPAAQSYQCELVPHQALRALDRGAPGRKIHEFTVNFPLYCGVRHLEIGVDPEAAVLPPSPPAQPGSLVFYGTSITQGACASRPGLSYPALLSRALGLPAYNFGFSGNGLGEPEMAALLSEIRDPLLYMIDYEANAGERGCLEATLEPLVQRLREAHPETPVLVVSKPASLFDALDPRKRVQWMHLRRFQRETVRRLCAELGRVAFLDGQTLLPQEPWDLTVDLVHPTDTGFAEMARGMLPAVRELLDEQPLCALARTADIRS